MRTTRIRRAAVVAAAAVVLPFALTACGEDSTTSKASSNDSDQGKADTSANQSDGPFGPACSQVPKSGPGSAEGMADDPVATAASNNPLLSTLTTAVTKAGLVDTLNDAEDITVFAPTNDAFKKVPKADLDKLLANKEELTKVLQYHVVGQTITPEQLENGTFESLSKQELTTSGSGENFTVNDSAKIVCGNVETANATVYLIDSVLMPPMASGSASPSASMSEGASPSASPSE